MIQWRVTFRAMAGVMTAGRKVIASIFTPGGYVKGGYVISGYVTASNYIKPGYVKAGYV